MCEVAGTESGMTGSGYNAHLRMAELSTWIHYYGMFQLMNLP